MQLELGAFRQFGSGRASKISMLRESQVKNTFRPDEVLQEVLTHWAPYRGHPEAPLCLEDDFEVAAHSPVRSLRRHGRHPLESSLAKWLPGVFTRLLQSPGAPGSSPGSLDHLEPKHLMMQLGRKLTTDSSFHTAGTCGPLSQDAPRVQGHTKNTSLSCDQCQVTSRLAITQLVRLGSSVQESLLQGFLPTLKPPPGLSRHSYTVCQGLNQ